MDLSRVTARTKLKPRREPYWERLSVGRFIGYRPSKIGGAGSFICKYSETDIPRTLHALGDFGHLPPNERYAEAKKAAENWFQHVQSGGSTRPVTVREVCERYASTRPDAAQRFKRHLYAEPLANIPLHKLRKAQVMAWREHLAATPAKVSRSKTGEQTTRLRSGMDLNRNLVPLRAALNLAKDDGLVVSDTAWVVALRPIVGADHRRNLYLDRKQRHALLKHLPSEALPFFNALCLLPLRPGALASLTAGDFDARRSELVVSHDKAGQARKILLPPATAALLKEQASGKLPAAPLFTRQDGRPWDRDSWKIPVKLAVHAARLPAAASAYTLRHSTITDLVTGGLDLLTIAQVAGTSVAMIERHYGHLQRHHAADALAALALPA